jgi:hypothetical protein
MQKDVPDPAEYAWEFETHGDVGVWNIRGWDGWTDETLEAVSRHYRLRGAEDDIAATIAVFGDKTQLPPETQEYMAEQWSDNGQYVGVDKIGFVAEGITGMAIKSNVEVPGAELDDFDTLDAALAWARDD